jgi:hypothetical protein
VPTDQEPARRVVLVPFARLAGWIERYDARHPDTAWTIGREHVHALSPDGARAEWDVPHPPLQLLSVDGLVDHVASPRRLGVLLVRKGGFAVARVTGDKVAESKIGQRHVQGRSKAGGWSQQRFARRRDNQAKEAYEAAAGHAARVLGPAVTRLDGLVLGGDEAGVRTVLEDRRLGGLHGLPEQWVHGVGDPKRAVLEAAIEQARSVQITVVDPTR